MNTVGVARGQSGFPLVAVLATALLLASARGAAGQPGTGEVVIAWHVTIAPSWFDPSTAPPQTAPFGILYALHDALVRPLPGQRMGPSLAESWKESPDGLTYEFKLRRGLKFHNGDPLKRRPSGAAGALRPAARPDGVHPCRNLEGRPPPGKDRHQ